MTPWLRGAASTGLTHLGYVEFCAYVCKLVCVHVVAWVSFLRHCVSWFLSQSLSLAQSLSSSLYWLKLAPWTCLSLSP